MTRAQAASLALLFSLAGCKNGDEARSCANDAAALDQEIVAPEDLRIHFDAPLDANLSAVERDLIAVLAKMWSRPSIEVAHDTPDLSAPYTIWISTSSAARALAGEVPASGYSLARVELPSGHRAIVAAAHDTTALAYAAYALLEALGARFFHPRETLIPELGEVRLPRMLHAARAPAFAVRGLQPHTLHPIEWWNALNGSTDADFAEAQSLIDWLVKTGQNHLQWPLLRTVPLATWTPYAARVIDYAHQRHVTAGVMVQAFGGSSLQNNYVLVKTATGAEAEIDAKLDPLLALPLDQIELALGEFVGAKPEDVIRWLDHAVAHTAEKRPETRVSVSNHVGNYPRLYVEYQGRTEYFYHLPQYADPRLIQSVHTLYFFDLYRDWAMYGHDNFFFQRDYLFANLPTRTVRYFPESAYWIGADIDVPLFLPEYVHARWTDIHQLTADVIAKGLPPIEGHVMFSSGHEWGYWLTDYLTAQMLWDPISIEDHFLQHYAAPYGSCAPGIAADLRALIDVETKYLFDARLVGYLAGENVQVDLGALAGFPTHPMPVAFEALAIVSPADRASFAEGTVAKLEAMAAELLPVERDVAAICAGVTADLAPWCAELLDGTAIVRLRAEHSAELYRAVLAALGQGGDADELLGRAAKTHEEAQSVIARRESHYRFDVERLTGVYENPTIYHFGYLRQAHTLCYWTRREDQAREVIRTRHGASPLDLPSCVE